MVPLLSWMTLILMLGLPDVVHAQSLTDLLRAERSKVQAKQLARRYGPQAGMLPPAHLATEIDTVAVWLKRVRPNQNTETVLKRPAFVVSTWHRVRKLERGWFIRRFGTTSWAFLGSNALTPLDTTMTRELRARMEASYGPPTRTLAEIKDPTKLSSEELIEFEYWFVLNDSIPMKVIDVNGPLERGLVIASDQRFRSILFELRQTFLGHLVRRKLRKPYVDYYYNDDAGGWYRAGFDGAVFFLRPIPKPELFRGRPRLQKLGG